MTINKKIVELQVFSERAFPENGKTRFAQKHFPEHTFSSNKSRPGFLGQPWKLDTDIKPPRVRPRRLLG